MQNYSIKYSGNLIHILFLAIIVWIAGIIFAPVFANSNYTSLKNISDFLYFFLKPVCHQFENRSFQIEGHALAVCVRCFAIYFAGIFVFLYYLLQKQIRIFSRIIYAILFFPAAIDFVLEKFEFYFDHPITRFITGFAFGIVFFQVLLVAILHKKLPVFNTEEKSMNKKLVKRIIANG